MTATAFVRQKLPTNLNRIPGGFAMENLFDAVAVAR